MLTFPRRYATCRLTRDEVFNPNEVAIIQTICRVVRRCFLFGFDPIVQRDSDNHKKHQTHESSDRIPCVPLFVPIAVGNLTSIAEGSLSGTARAVRWPVLTRPARDSPTRSNSSIRFRFIKKPMRVSNRCEYRFFVERKECWHSSDEKD